MYKISGSYDKAQEFHKSWKFNTQQKSTYDQPAKKISNKLEMDLKILQKIMINPNIQK